MRSLYSARQKRLVRYTAVAARRTRRNSLLVADVRVVVVVAGFHPRRLYIHDDAEHGEIRTADVLISR